MEWIQQQLDGILPKKPGSPSPLPKTLASIAVLTSSFFALQNLSQRFAGKIGLYAGRAMPITTGVGFAVTAINICASNCALSQFQDVWDREIDHIPTHKGERVELEVLWFCYVIAFCSSRCASWCIFVH